jgi:signal peptidase II
LPRSSPADWESAVAAAARALAITGVVVAVDQATKQAVVASLARSEVRAVVPGLDLTNTRNTGVAFGALEGAGTIVGLLIGAALVILLGYFALNASVPWLWLPVGLLLGGALGNLADRAREGGVIDFIDPVAWPAFNVADACIVVAVPGLIYVVEARGRRAS